MYNFKMPIVHTYDSDYDKRKELLVEVLGYTEEELEQFSKTMYMCNVAINLTLGQLELIVKPFYDNDIHICITDCCGNHLSFPQAGINLTKEPPKDHYYDKPVVSRDQLVDPFTQKEKERREILAQPDSAFYANIPKCPTCQSPNVEKISLSSKVVGGALFGLFSSNVRKTMHCKNCGYKW